MELYEQQRAGVKAGPLLERAIPRPAVRAILKQLSFQPENRSGSALEAGEQMAAALVGPEREAWSRRRVAGVLLGCGGAIAAGAYEWRNRERPLDPRERLIELPMGTEPLERGFQKDPAVDYHLLLNAKATGTDSIRVMSTDQGGFFHPFSPAQSRAAYRNGWRMIVDAAVEEGALHSLVDNARDPHRYALNLLRNPDGTETVRCFLGFTPESNGLDWTLHGPAGARHRFEMVWTPGPAGADLLVDGVKRISGYQGVADFRYARGLQFGAARYESQRGSGLFWKIRLEIA